MKRAKTAKRLFTAMGLVLSHLMCAHIAYAYCNMWWLGKTSLTSAPPRVVFFFMIPYGAGIAVCALLAWMLGKRAKQA